MARQLSEIKREFKHSLSRPGILQVIGQHEIKTLHLVRNKHDNELRGFCSYSRLIKKNDNSHKNTHKEKHRKKIFLKYHFTHQYLLNKECAVRRTPLITWKSPLWKRFTISVNKSGHFWGKSSLPIMLIASLNWGQERDSLDETSTNKPPNKQGLTYLLLNLLRAAKHQVHYVSFNGYSVGFTNFIWFIFNLKAKH